MRNYRSFWRKKQGLLLCLSVAAVLLGIGVLLWTGKIQAVFSLKRGNGQGVVLLPENPRQVPDTVCYFWQKDPRWAGDRLGEARDTMASSGCLVCSLAAGLRMQENGSASQNNRDDIQEGWPDGQENKENSPTLFSTAGDLNRLFSQAQVYTKNGAVIWDRIPEAVPGTVTYVAEGVDAGEIDGFLARGIFPAVKVRVGGTGAFHWVLLVGADGNGYLSMDPLKEDPAAVSLEEFGNRVYAVRAVYYEDAAVLQD